MKSLWIAMMLILSTAVAVAEPKAPKDVIGLEKATAIAMKTASGKLESSELEFEKGQWVYSFDIRGEDQKIHEVLVNSQSGKIVSNKTESAAEEAKEKIEDQKSK